MNQTKGQQRIFVLFGATGDLASQMLWPSLYALDRDNLLPETLQIVGLALTDFDRDAFVSSVEAHVLRKVGTAFEHDIWRRLAQRIHYISGDVTDERTYTELADRCGPNSNITFYLSTSPALYAGIVEKLGRRGLAKAPGRVVVEKPLGHDLASCNAVNASLAAAFSEDRVFRIDHYLGKETVQNLLALRFANTIFQPLWDHSTIDHVQITATETVGVGDRAQYYNRYGALRDMVQSHLLQLLCLVAMEPPSQLDPDAIRDEKVKVLRSLRSITSETAPRVAIRGQYGAGMSNGVAVSGYRSEAHLESAHTETFVAICAHIDNWRWAGVPFYLRTGKRLSNRKTQIVIQYRPLAHSIFSDATLEANRLVIDLQPDEGVTLQMMNKRAVLEGAGYTLQRASLDLAQSVEAPQRRIAYERLILEALHNRSTLFVRRDEIEAAWRWIDAIHAGWLATDTAPLPYAAGSWGPSSAIGLIERDGRSWFD